MAHPIGYYTNYTPGDSGLLEDMQESWGAQFQELNNSERLWMLYSLIGTITANPSENYEPSEVSDCIMPAIERFNELSLYDQLGLAEALINQIKYHRHRG